MFLYRVFNEKLKVQDTLQPRALRASLVQEGKVFVAATFDFFLGVLPFLGFFGCFGEVHTYVHTSETESDSAFLLYQY